MSRTERIELWLRLDRMENPGDVFSWTIDGEPLTGLQLVTLLSFTQQDAEDALALLRLSNELSEP